LENLEDHSESNCVLSEKGRVLDEGCGYISGLSDSKAPLLIRWSMDLIEALPGDSRELRYFVLPLIHLPIPTCFVSLLSKQILSPQCCFDKRYGRDNVCLIILTIVGLFGESQFESGLDAILAAFPVCRHDLSSDTALRGGG